MSEFIDECRREWRRLGVPDPVANEMAADLTADLEEAEAEGGSPEDVLGNSVFDPRRFAAAWATARGVTGPPPAPDRPSPWRPPVAFALTVLLGLVTAVAALMLLVGRSGTSIAVAARRFAAAPGPFRLLRPGPGPIVVPVPAPFTATRFAGVDLHPLAVLVLVAGVVGLGLVTFLYWTRRPGFRRHHPDGGGRSPRWN